MSFQGYLNTIKARTGLEPDDFRRIAAQRGLDGPDTKASAVIAWLAEEYGLGRGHAMAIVAVLKGRGPAADADPSATGASEPPPRRRRRD